MNYTPKPFSNSTLIRRCVCCGSVLLHHERTSGYCFRHFIEIPYEKRMSLRKVRRAAS